MVEITINRTILSLACIKTAGGRILVTVYTCRSVFNLDSFSFIIIDCCLLQCIGQQNAIFIVLRQSFKLNLIALQLILIGLLVYLGIDRNAVGRSTEGRDGSG